MICVIGGCVYFCCDWLIFWELAIIMIAFFFVCLIILIPVDVGGSCPHISGQASINPEGLRVYIDLNDEEVQDG